MDGFEDNRGIVVLGATNRPGAIDAALIRPGRFDRIIYMPLPDAAGRAKILQVAGAWGGAVWCVCVVVSGCWFGFFQQPRQLLTITTNTKTKNLNTLKKTNQKKLSKGARAQQGGRPVDQLARGRARDERLHRRRLHGPDGARGAHGGPPRARRHH